MFGKGKGKIVIEDEYGTTVIGVNPGSIINVGGTQIGATVGDYTKPKKAKVKKAKPKKKKETYWWEDDNW